LACLREILAHDPDSVVLVVTGHSGLTVAVQALRAGAKNFIMKPWSSDRLLDAIEEALTQQRKSGFPSLDAGVDPGLIVGECDAIVRIRDLIARYAPLTAGVLVAGESGVGKSLVAQAIHRQSSRSELRVVNAASLSMDHLVDISDATFVLEDIDALDPDLALPLNAWIQGAGQRNTRVVATTCRRPSDTGLQKALLYALSTLEIVVPPLRDRGNDIELLARHFARVFALRQGLGARDLAPDALLALRKAAWTDNLHALRRIVERAVATAPGLMVTAEDLDLPRPDAAALDLSLSLEEKEKSVIEEALSRNNFNISKAAVELKLTRQTLYRRMARHGL
jgi:DNA-binding NtrC family response regulator